MGSPRHRALECAGVVRSKPESVTNLAQLRLLTGFPHPTRLPCPPGSAAIAPNDVAPACLPLPPLLDHALFLGRHEIVQGIATHVREAMLPEQRLDFLPRPAFEEWQPVADRRVLRAHAGILPRW